VRHNESGLLCESEIVFSFFLLEAAHSLVEKSQERKREKTKLLFVSATEKFIFLSFLLFSPLEKNLFCMIVRFGYIGALDSEWFLCGTSRTLQIKF
jgi:hypothetical protein